jgi:hypothetical protein
MMIFLKVNKVTGYRYDPYLEEEAQLPKEPERTVPEVINLACVKSWYPRKNNRVGTRINFVGGHGLAVKETLAELDVLINVEGVLIRGEHASATVIPLEANEAVN